MKYASYENYFDAWKTKVEEEKEAEFRSEKIYSLESYLINPPKSNGLLTGEESFRRFENLMENGTSWKRHIFQKEFHKKVSMVLAQNIIGEDWNVISPVLSIAH